MFYRRKLILALLQVFGGKLPQINLYKLLLIISKQQQKPEYDFVPYMYGCYSFSLNADLETMIKKNMVRQEIDKSIHKGGNKNYLSELKDSDKKIILSIHRNFVNSSSDDLIRYTYIHYPYTAVRSSIAKKLLSNEELEKVKTFKPFSQEITLYTIGYEGISLEEYFNRLIKNDVKVLVDVRNNPLSMKFGFSKNQLKKYCEKLFIEYIHIPQVGIRSEFRQELNTQSDYDKLFADYEKNNLSQTISYQQEILNLLKSRNRIALTCFEANICMCHRKHLAEAITKLPEWNYELKHI
ncbi:MAG TPA: DUF488 domain-containing protein [Chitinophagaceae bacterium]|nr:DUF488 domain-containing protein [Chitinophagaceae bacterium]